MRSTSCGASLTLASSPTSKPFAETRLIIVQFFVFVSNISIFRTFLFLFSSLRDGIRPCSRGGFGGAVWVDWEHASQSPSSWGEIPRIVRDLTSRHVSLASWWWWYLVLMLGSMPMQESWRGTFSSPSWSTTFPIFLPLAHLRGNSPINTLCASCDFIGFSVFSIHSHLSCSR